MIKNTIFKKILFSSCLIALFTQDTITVLAGNPGEGGNNETTQPTEQPTPVANFGQPIFQNLLDWFFYKTFGPGVAIPVSMLRNLPNEIESWRYFWHSTLEDTWNRYIAIPYNGHFHGLRPPNEAMERLTELFDTIKGQDEAKSEVFKFVATTFLDFKAFSESGSNPRGHILVLAGTSGTGKSMMAKGILAAMFADKKSYLFKGSSCISHSTGQMGQSLTIKEQFFGTGQNEYFDAGSHNAIPVKQESSVTEFFAKHQRGCAVCFDEYDKMCRKDDGTIDNSLDELFRIYGDNGFFALDANRTIPCPYSIIILTTNEARYCLINELITPEGNSVPEAQQNPLASSLDGTTHTNRDRSLLNRFYVALFYPLTRQNYREIIQNLCTERCDLINREYHFTIQIAESALENLINMAQYAPGGMHTVRATTVKELSGLAAQTQYSYYHAKQNPQGRIFNFYCDLDKNRKLKDEKPASSSLITFKRPENWQIPYLYACQILPDENASAVEILGNFPGIPMSAPLQDDPDTFQFEIPEGFFHIEQLPVPIRVTFSDPANEMFSQIPEKDGFLIEQGEKANFCDGNWKSELIPNGERISEVVSAPEQPHGLFSCLKSFFTQCHKNSAPNPEEDSPQALVEQPPEKLPPLTVRDTSEQQSEQLQQEQREYNQLNEQTKQEENKLNLDVY